MMSVMQNAACNCEIKLILTCLLIYLIFYLRRLIYANKWCRSLRTCETWTSFLCFLPDKTIDFLTSLSSDVLCTTITSIVNFTLPEELFSSLLASGVMKGFSAQGQDIMTVSPPF